MRRRLIIQLRRLLRRLCPLLRLFYLAGFPPAGPRIPINVRAQRPSKLCTGASGSAGGSTGGSIVPVVWKEGVRRGGTLGSGDSQENTPPHIVTGGASGSTGHSSTPDVRSRAPPTDNVEYRRGRKRMAGDELGRCAGQAVLNRVPRRIQLGGTGRVEYRRGRDCLAGEEPGRAGGGTQGLPVRFDLLRGGTLCSNEE